MNWIGLLLFSTISLAAGEVPYGFVLDGVLYDSPGGTTTLLDTGVIRVQILNPAKDCVLYDEQQNFNTTTSNGAFSLSIGTAVGSGRRVAGSDAGNSMTTVFQNRTASITGAGACTYNPTAGDGRYVRVFVTPTSTGVTDPLSPEMLIGSVPTSLVAESLQGITKTGFLQLGAQDLTQANVESVFTTANFATLTSLLSGGGSTGGTNTGAYTINSGTGGSGGINFNTNGTTRASIAYNGDFTVGSNALFVNGSTGKVGLGTNSTTYDFSLGGAISRAIGMERNSTVNTAGNSLTVSSGGATSGATDKAGGDLYLASGAATGTGSSNIFLQTATAGGAGTTDRSPTTKMTILGDGSVGIGTASPARLLHVNGPVRITPSSAPSSAAAGDFYFDSAWSNKLTWHNGVSWQEVPRTNIWDNTAYVPAGAGANGTPNVARNEYMNSAGLDGAAFITGMTVRNTAGDLQAAYMGTTSNASGLTPNLIFGQKTTATDYAERMRINGNGNVGIGTTDPKGLLQVGSDLSFETNWPAIAFNASPTSTRLSANAAAKLMVDYGASKLNFMVGTSGAAGSAIAWNTAMAIDHATANVGIGTVNPSSKLHVIGSGDIVNTIQTSSGSGSSAAIRLIGGAPNADWHVVTNRGDLHGSADNLAFYKTSGTSGTKMVIQDNGRVGIGTTSPTANLEVSINDTNASGGGIRLTDTAANGYISLLDGTGTAGAFAPMLQGRPASAARSMYIDSALKAGEDSGSVAALTLRSSVNGGALINRPVLSIQNYGSDLMTIAASGNVGIGTTNPGYKLDVVGDIAASGCLRSSAGVASGICVSDERLKTDVQPFDLGLEALLGINPHFFRYNGLGGHPVSDKPELGVLAQEVEKAAPQLIVTKEVTLNPEDNQTTEIKQVNYTAFTYVLINAVKDLYHRWFDDSQAIHREIASVKTESAAKDRKIQKLEQENLVKTKELEAIKSYLCAKDPQATICK